MRSGRAASGALAPSHANDARGPASAQSPEVERCYALSASETIDRACVLAKMHHIPSQISTPLHRHISHLLQADESNEDYTSQCFPFPDKSVTTASPTEATPSRGFRVIVATTPLVATESIVSAVVYSTTHLVTG